MDIKLTLLIKLEIRTLSLIAVLSTTAVNTFVIK